MKLDCCPTRERPSSPAEVNSGATTLTPIVRGVLAAAGLGAAACLTSCGAGAKGGEEPVDGRFDTERGELHTTTSPSGTISDDPGFGAVPCGGDEYAAPRYLEDVRPAQPVDYVEHRLPYAVLETRGQACSTASDAANCLARLAALPDEPGFMLGHLVQVIESHHLRATRGDAVLRVSTPLELSAFLGPIDSLSDAFLLVASRNYSLICGESGAVQTDGGFDVLAFTQEGCDGRTRHLLRVEPDGSMSSLDVFVERTPDPHCVVGRRPEGLAKGSVRRRTLGEFFAGCAELEAASVPAFMRLARELAAHGAPPELVYRARVAALEEVRHARRVGSLALRFGVRPRWPRVPVGRVRSLESVARENAVEGCVRETYGVLVGAHQARTSPLAAVARLYESIAGDELRHAELSWDVARWAERRLGRGARRSVSEFRKRAAAELEETLQSAVPTPADVPAGLPSPEVSLAFAQQLRSELWRGDRALA